MSGLSKQNPWRWCPLCERYAGCNPGCPNEHLPLCSPHQEKRCPTPDLCREVSSCARAEVDRAPCSDVDAVLSDPVPNPPQQQDEGEVEMRYWTLYACPHGCDWREPHLFPAGYCDGTELVPHTRRKREPYQVAPVSELQRLQGERDEARDALPADKRHLLYRAHDARDEAARLRAEKERLRTRAEAAEAEAQRLREALHYIATNYATTPDGAQMAYAYAAALVALSTQPPTPRRTDG